MLEMTNQTIPSVKRRQIIELAESGKRTDGRSLTDIRKVEIQTNVVEKADGSAAVKLGDTYVIAGVKFDCEKPPFPDIPNEGVLSVNAEFVPIASAEFEAGPPNENAIELARVVDRGLRESKSLDTSKLCIIPGKKVWTAHVDVYILDHCGNLIDASALAAISALLTSKMPKSSLKLKVIKVSGIETQRILECKFLNGTSTNLKIEEGSAEGEVQEIKEFSVEKAAEGSLPIPIRDRPVNITLAKIGDKFFVDPSLEEEEIMDCRISVTFTEDGRVCAMQKGGAGTMTPDELLRAVEIAKVKSQELRNLIPQLVKTDG
jgi:exosome complex component RRP42